jgi:hypothetical protein
MQKLQPVLLFILAVCFLPAFSQQFIDKSREKVLKKLNSYEKKEKINTTISETDSSITFLLRDTGWQNLDQHFFFNQKGKCYKEVLTANCDSCFQKYLNQTLDINMYKWKMISASRYISNYSWQLVLEIDPKSAFTYSIQKLNLPKDEFKQLGAVN